MPVSTVFAQTLLVMHKGAWISLGIEARPKIQRWGYAIMMMQ